MSVARSQEELHAWIRLTKTGASARRLGTLLDHFGSPAALFAATPGEVATAARCTPEVAAKLLDPHHAPVPRELDLMERLQVRLLTREEDDYPPLLREIHDPPVALYVRGTLAPEERCVAIVGSRRASDYGRRVAGRLAAELTEAGVTVVSGLARGLDTAAHWGAIRAGGRTLACLGCGVDVTYPYENRRLADAVVSSGALLSEYPMMAPPDAWHFPSRNRIVSGLSLGVVLIEAPARSGALITIQTAADQGREVFAVPGNVDNALNAGAHALLKDGARLVESAEDILSELREPTTMQGTLELGIPAPPPELDAGEQALFALLGPDPKPVDDLILESSFPPAQVNATLLMLEIKGVARRLPGNSFIRLG
jgi:DNA processing protein